MHDGSWFKSTRCYSPVTYRQYGLGNYVDVITDITDELNREEKTLRLRMAGTFAYDYLILTPGLSYRPSSMHTDLPTDAGAFGINWENEKEIENVIAGLITSSESVVVYGRSLQSLAAIQRI
jgi:NADH dehydrogenase FAD-containing subunit